MTSTNDMLKAIQEKIAQAHPNLSVELFPDRPDQYRLNHPVGAVLVSYSGSSYTTENLINVSSCMREMNVSLTMMVRSLNGDKGAIAITDSVRNTIHGQVLEGALSNIELVKDSFAGNDNGIWQYLLDIKFNQLIRD
jgi:hypothetical protein